MGPKHAGVTLGREGYLWREQDGGGHVPAFSLSATDTTGAGDAFHGAFALMLAEGAPAKPTAPVAVLASNINWNRASLECDLTSFEQ
jgi:sulfofructose kinase